MNDSQVDISNHQLKYTHLQQKISSLRAGLNRAKKGCKICAFLAFSAVTTFYHAPNGAVHRINGALVEPEIYKNLVVFY